MSSQPFDGNDVSAAGGLLLAGFIFFTKLTCALVSFLALLLTILALIAWNRRLRIGSIVMEPHEARAFILGGLTGSLLAPAFVIFANVFFGMAFDWHAHGLQLVLGGYIAGSVGIGIMMADEGAAPAAFHAPAALPPQPMRALPDQLNFQFATWNDEEKRG